MVRLFILGFSILYLSGVYSVSRITINEYYMNFINYDIVNCNIDLSVIKQYRRSKDYIFNYTYSYNGKVYSGSNRFDNISPKTKVILKGKSNVKLYVSPIFPSYTVVERPDIKDTRIWFSLIFMTILFIFVWYPIVWILLKILSGKSTDDILVDIGSSLKKT